MNRTNPAKRRRRKIKSPSSRRRQLVRPASSSQVQQQYVVLLSILLLLIQTQFFCTCWSPGKFVSRVSQSARVKTKSAIQKISVPLPNRHSIRIVSQDNDPTTTNDDVNNININNNNNNADILKAENNLLRDAVRELEVENERLKQGSAGRIILETFEGEGRFRERDHNYMNSTFLDASSGGGGGITMSGVELEQDGGQWCDALEEGQCPVEPTISFGEALRDRAYWLVGLLVLQSLSGFILARNEALLDNHPVIIYFLTMLVGAGGNAGNQASVRVIRGLALGTLNEQTRNQFMAREFRMALALSSILSIAGFARAIFFRTPFPEALAVTVALTIIVFSSVCLGAILPLILEWLGVDPAHSSTTIQVIMDILGVILAVTVSRAILDGPFGVFLLAKLGG